MTKDNTVENIKYAVKINQNANGSFTAVLLDFPQCQAGIGASEQEAQMDLMDKALPVLDPQLQMGTLPPPQNTKGTHFVILGGILPIKASG